MQQNLQNNSNKHINKSNKGANKKLDVAGGKFDNDANKQV